MALPNRSETERAAVAVEKRVAAPVGVAVTAAALVEAEEAGTGAARKGTTWHGMKKKVQIRSGRERMGQGKGATS